MKRAKINTIEDGPTVEEIKIESGFNNRFSNTEKSPARLIKMKGKKEKKKDQMRDHYGEEEETSLHILQILKNDEGMLLTTS